MASQNLTGYRAFMNGANALSAFTRVAVSADGTLYAAAASDTCIGTLQYDAAANDDGASVRLISAPGTPKMIASAAISAWGYVYSYANGLVAGAPVTGSVTVGIAAAPSPAVAVGLAAVTGGAVIEVLPAEGLTLQ